MRGVARLAGVVSPKRRVEQVLDVVGLSGRAKDRYNRYSLGMKQRLGVASALLKDPELLILDEPTNGLDPKGMAEMRDLVRLLGRGERTVLLSSHLMGEVEQVCDRVGIISRGRLVAEGSVDELKGERRLMLRAEPLEQAAYIARRISGVEGVEISGGALWLNADPERAAEISLKMFSAGVKVREFRQKQRSLEEVFLELTEEKGGE